MAYDRAMIYVEATAAEQTAYANTDRLKTVGSTVYLSFPMRYVAKNGVHINPHVREEIKAYRDENTRKLTRVTASGTKTSISMDIMGGRNNAEKKEIIAWFTAHEIDSQQRKITLLYYDADYDNYGTGTFYRADTEYTILTTTANDIIWDAFTIDLVEY